MRLKLNEYFNSLKYYDFFDELFYYETLKKDVIISKLGLNYNTYRTVKRRKQIDNKIIEKLSNYFGINIVQINKQQEYEILINRIYYEAYYKQKDSLNKLLKRLNEYIKENNILKPLLVLMKIYDYLNLDLSMDELNNLKDDLDYIFKFKRNYFNGDYKFLQELILFFFDYNVDKNKLEASAIKNDTYNWLYYVLLGSYYYLRKKDHEALIKYYEALKIIKQNNNEIREMTVVTNIAHINNILEEYNTSLSYTNQIVEYAYSSKNDLYVSYLTQHYLYAKYMLGQKDDIYEFLKIIEYEISKLNVVSTIISILSITDIDLELVNRLIEEKHYDSDVKIIDEYLKTGNKTILNRITKTPYLIKIVDKL